MAMAFRSHLLRSIDLRVRSNTLLVATIVVAALVVLVAWLSGADGSTLLAPVYVFLTWALLREIDPDHGWTAVAGGIGGGAWVLLGGSLLPGLAVAGLVLAARLVTSSTGRRPLPIDLAAATAIGAFISLTLAGWVAGFGVAVAIYLDDRLSGATRVLQVGASATTAIGATLVATARQVFPSRVPEVLPYLVLGAGVLALLVVVREPAEPTTRVDARHGALIPMSRLHASRTLIAVLVFVMVVFTGPDAGGAVPLLAALLAVIGSNEVELLRRRSK